MVLFCFGSTNQNGTLANESLICDLYVATPPAHRLTPYLAQLTNFELTWNKNFRSENQIYIDLFTPIMATISYYIGLVITTQKV